MTKLESSAMPSVTYWRWKLAGIMMSSLGLSVATLWIAPLLMGKRDGIMMKPLLSEGGLIKRCWATNCTHREFFGKIIEPAPWYYGPILAAVVLMAGLAVSIAVRRRWEAASKEMQSEVK